MHRPTKLLARLDAWTALLLFSVLLSALSVTGVHAQAAAVSSRPLARLALEREPLRRPAQRRKGRGLRIGGAVVLMASYAATAGVSLGFLISGGLNAAAASGDPDDSTGHCKTCSASGLMLLPIAGPWIALAEGEPVGPVPAVLLGLGQLVGAVMLVVGWAPWANKGYVLGRSELQPGLQLYAAPWHEGAAIGARLTF